MNKNNRLRELDFLRGIAIILVIFRHKPVFEFTTSIGWTGVDLFFVLSGFLVSGLLFKEYQKFGDIKPIRFLIRRGFKIYPIYYLFFLIYLFPMFDQNRLNTNFIVSDLLFIQNYVTGLGYAYSASWSLAVEEHFYIGLAIFLWALAKFNFIPIHKPDSDAKISRFELTIIGIMITCISIRLIIGVFFPELISRHSTMTHMRIDSLLAGVLVAYIYYFRREKLISFYNKYKKYFIPAIIFGTMWTFIKFPVPTVIESAFGLSFLYLAFALILITFLIKPDINISLNKLFGSPTVNIISKIGYCSYSIYIIHLFVVWAVHRFELAVNITFNHYLDFTIVFLLCIGLGMFMTYRIENYFLKIRDKLYPSRIN